MVLEGAGDDLGGAGAVLVDQDHQRDFDPAAGPGGAVLLIRTADASIRVDDHLTLGEFVAFMGYLAMLTWPTIAGGWVINIFQRGSASMGRILEMMDAAPEIHYLQS